MMTINAFTREEIENEALDVRHVGRILVALCRAEALTEGGAQPAFLNSIRYLGDRLDAHAEALLNIGRPS